MFVPQVNKWVHDTVKEGGTIGSTYVLYVSEVLAAKVIPCSCLPCCLPACLPAFCCSRPALTVRACLTLLLAAAPPPPLEKMREYKLEEARHGRGFFARRSRAGGEPLPAAAATAAAAAAAPAPAAPAPAGAEAGAGVEAGAEAEAEAEA
eukprot:SAG22_NODE_338_length_12038_cov_24.655583_10_plen_149_part_01